MSNSTSTLDLLSVNQANKELTQNAMNDAFYPASFGARRDSTCAGLTWGYYGGNVRNGSNAPIQVANGTLTLTASSTNYISHVHGAMSCTTVMPSAWPGPLGGGAVALYEVVTDTASALSWKDWRNMGADPVTTVPKRIGTLAFSATPTFDFSAYDIIRMTLTGNITSVTFSGAVDGQSCQLELSQDATGSRTLGAWGSQVRASADLSLPVLSTTANKMDKIGFQYDGAASKYDLVAVLKGF